MIHNVKASGRRQKWWQDLLTHLHCESQTMKKESENWPSTIHYLHCFHWTTDTFSIFIYWITLDVESSQFALMQIRWSHVHVVLFCILEQKNFLFCSEIWLLQLVRVNGQKRRRLLNLCLLDNYRLLLVLITSYNPKFGFRTVNPNFGFQSLLRRILNFSIVTTEIK